MKNEFQSQTWLEKYNRLRLVAASLGVSLNRLESECGVSHGGFKNPSTFNDVINSKFAPKFPRINAEWILSGTGSVDASPSPASFDELTVLHQMILERDKYIQELENKLLVIAKENTRLISIINTQNT